jgi:DbpA-like RNA binding protein
LTLDAKAALERGRPVVLVTPPAVEQAGELWELLPATPGQGRGVGPPVVIVCADDVSAAEWASAAPGEIRVHAVTGLARAGRMLKEGSVHILAGAVQDLAVLVERSVLKLDGISTVVVAWPETLAASEHAATLDTLLGEAREARRIVLSWNPTAIGDFLERHARRALVVGSPPLLDTGGQPPPIGPARYAIVPASRRSAAARQAVDVLDPRRPLVWDGGGGLEMDALPDSPDAVLCTRLPTREQFAALAALGEPLVFITAAQLPYLRSLAAPLTPVQLPSAADRARDRGEALRERVARLLTAGNVDGELALLDPLFERFDPAEVAAAVLALVEQTGRGMGQGSALEPAAATWTKVFVNVGKKDRAAAKDFVGALIREVGIGKEAVGRIDVRETFSLVEVASGVAEKVVRGLTGVVIKGRRALARLDRQA